MPKRKVISGTFRSISPKVQENESLQNQLEFFQTSSQISILSMSLLIMILIGEPDSPILWNGCGNTDITNQPIRSMSNKLWIESHLEGSGHSFSFQVLVF